MERERETARLDHVEGDAEAGRRADDRADVRGDVRLVERQSDRLRHRASLVS